MQNFLFKFLSIFLSVALHCALLVFVLWQTNTSQNILALFSQKNLAQTSVEDLSISKIKKLLEASLGLEQQPQRFVGLTSISQAQVAQVFQASKQPPKPKKKTKPKAKPKPKPKPKQKKEPQAPKKVAVEEKQQTPQKPAEPPPAAPEPEPSPPENQPSQEQPPPLAPTEVQEPIEEIPAKPTTQAPPPSQKPAAPQQQTSLSPQNLQTINIYSSNIQKSLIINWSRPPSIERGENLKVDLRLELERDGRVHQVYVIQSSGDRFFDRSAVSAIYKIRRFKLPEDDFLYQQYFQKINLSFTNPK